MNGATRRRKLAASLRRYVAAYEPEVTAIAQRQFTRWRVGTGWDMLLEMRSLTMAIAVSGILRLPPTPTGSRWANCSGLHGYRVLGTRACPASGLPGLPYYRLQVLSARLERAVRELVDRRHAQSIGTDGLYR